MKLADAAALVMSWIEETLYYYAFPRRALAKVYGQIIRWSACYAKCAEGRER
jgi:hypothetical protein